MMNHRSQKKTVFGLIYLAMLFCIAYLVYLPFKPPETCSDGKKNQDESGVDCGGVCGVACRVEPILNDVRVQETAWVVGKPGEYDFLGKLENPNNDYGASRVSYVFRVIGVSGTVLVEKSGETFILPKEEKYVIETSVSLLQQPARIELSLTGTEWEKFSGYKEKPRLDIYNRRFEKTISGVGFGDAKGLVVNNSPFDFSIIDVLVVLRDGNGGVVALQKTDMRTLRSGQQRDFTLSWPDPFFGVVEKVEVQADANVYEMDTFIRQYVPTMTESFQDLNRP